MRSFTFVGGGSDKFWEVGRDGSTVTLRFGRTGTKGRTRTKQFPGEQAARDHVDKLVAEKLAKGYVEEAGTADVPSVAAESEPAPGPVRQEEPPPAPADEDAWVVPAAWWRHVEPWRGVSPPRTVQVDHAAVAAYEARRRGTAHRLQAALQDPDSDPDLVREARRPQPSPLGAAVVALVVGAEAGWDEPGAACAVDAWVAEHGLVFAAEAGALLAGIQPYAPAQWHGGWTRHRNFAVQKAGPKTAEIAFDPYPVLSRLRTFLAATDEGTYADAVEHLDALRGEGAQVRAATSFLLPTQREWAAADVRESVAHGPRLFAPPLLASAATADQLRDMLGLLPRWHLGRRLGLLQSAAAYTGPAAAPLLDLLYEDGSAEEQRRVLGMLAQLPTDEAFGLLLARLDQRYVQSAVLEAMNRFPRRAVRMLAAAATGTGPKPVMARELLRGLLVSDPDLADRVELTGTAAVALQKVAGSIVAVDRAPADAVPPLLTRPPWEARRKTPKPLVVEGLEVPAERRVVWLPHEREAWSATATPGAWQDSRTDWNKAVLETLGGYGRRWIVAAVLAHGPVDLVRPLLDRTTHGIDDYSYLPWMQRILGRFEAEGVEFVLQQALAKPAELAGALLPVADPGLAIHMAEWLSRLKSARSTARAWFLRHPQVAAQGLLPPALGRPGKERTYAEGALRFLAANGGREAIIAAAQAAGPAACEGVEALLSVDPVDVLPARMPALPAWLEPAHLPPVRLADRSGALPRDAVANLCLMLAICRPGEAYAGVEAVRPQLDPADLAAFVWAIFERWRGAEYPSRDSWVLEALGLLGDDEVVRRLAPLIRAWPGEGASARATNALDVLSAIGTDVALMHLHGIAEKVSFKGLKAKAAEKIAEIADGLGLTPDQLADRLVPDLGLDERGGMLLDYGPRRFRVGFDEQLKPVVFDSDGSRRKLLPKPAAKDDAALAEAAYARFTALKKDVKTIATDQIKRFERAMVTGRRWTAADHRRLFVDHPLLTHLAARLVWLTVDQDGTPTGSFRVAEDRTYADETDSELAVPADATVGIAHPLHLGAESVRAWGEVFADYEILQPFPQLGRDTYALTDDERPRVELERFHGSVVPTGRVLGLTHRGWERGTPQDGGVTPETYRHVGGDLYVVADLDPGIIAGAAMEEKVQTLTRVWLSRGVPDWGRSHGTAAFGELDAVMVSEILRDLEMLRG